MLVGSMDATRKIVSLYTKGEEASAMSLLDVSDLDLTQVSMSY